MAKFNIAFFILILIGSLTMIPKAQAGKNTTTITLNIESFAYEQHKGLPDWGYNGNPPYINLLDYPVHFTLTGSLARCTGNYTFENLPSNAENVTNVILWVYARNNGSSGSESNLNCHPWNGSIWDYNFYDYKISLMEGVGWDLYSVDWDEHGTVDDVNSVNNAELFIESATPWIGTSPWCNVDFAYLNVTCDIPPPPPPPEIVVDKYFGLGLFIGGIILMIFAPSWVAWAIKKKGITPDTVERAGYAMLIFLIGLGLFLSYIYSGA